MTDADAAKVLVIGAVNVDLVVAAERLPGPGETVVGPDVSSHGGGKGANAAVAAARAGAVVRYCGAVGDDEMGAGALGELAEEGIDVTEVSRIDGVSTGAALIVVDPSGENQIAVGAGANARVAADDVRAAVARAADWGAGCVLTSTEITPDAAVAAVKAAAEHGITCVVNPAPVLDELVGVLSVPDILTPNSSELRDLYARTLSEGRHDPTEAEMATALAEHLDVTVVVTLGADGVLVVDRSGATSVPAGEVESVVDTTGAGDTFNGVLAASLAAGHDLVTAARRSAAAASLTVAHVGARTGMPTAEALERAPSGS
ncbi:PfkB family carbohydrate kinase [Gordonia alkanivorans]|uniref:PfkB family carbohydrate kinase n=1 Tax=Gordonia alkanivorans TaxID=84096 RepID=UPI0024478B5E|nr:PfkB family carbohydrate kinase [Gordonia alkanivorans]MDH3021085.1 PfkB family carbohydrate kinase [Gordonia alkanivorans]